MLHQIIRSWCTASPLQTVPNVTAHPSTAGVPITVLLYDDPLLCGFKVAIKGLTFGINGDINKDIMQHTGCAFNKRTAVRKVYSRHSGQYHNEYSSEKFFFAARQAHHLSTSSIADAAATAAYHSCRCCATCLSSPSSTHSASIKSSSNANFVRRQSADVDPDANSVAISSDT